MFRGDRAGTGDPNCPKGYYRQHNIMLSIQRRRKGRSFVMMVLVFLQATARSDGALPALLELAEHLPSLGRGEFIPCCALLVRLLFPY